MIPSHPYTSRKKIMNRQPLRRSDRTNFLAGRQPQPWRAATELELERLRWQLLDTVRGFKVAGLDLFFSAIFSSSDMVQAYFEPRPLEVGRGNRAGQFTVTPFDASLRAANSATRYNVLLPPERGLAGVASFLHAAACTSSLRRWRAKVAPHPRSALAKPGCTARPGWKTG